jgi:YidC/Oxa1 family membrane protein insertase
MQSQQPDNQKNLILAIVLSMAVVVGWQFFYAGPKFKEEQERLKRVQAETQQTQGQTSPAASGAAGSPPAAVPAGQPAVPGVASATVARTREQALAGTPRVAIDTQSIKGSIALKGARFDDITFVKYHETVDPKSPNVTLFSPVEAPQPYFAEYGWVAAPGVTQKLPDRDTLWTQAGAGPLAPKQPVRLTWDNGQGLKFDRSIAVDDDYMFTITDTVENTTGAEVTLYPYARIHRVGLPNVQGYYILHEGPIGYVGEAGLQELSYTDMLKPGSTKTIEKAGNGWLGFTDKYWAATLVPNQGEVYTANFRGTKGTGDIKDSFQTDYTLSPQTIAAGQKKTVEGRLFAGAKKVQLIQHYADELKIKRFDLMVDWGWFYFITKPMFWLISLLSSVLGNFGLAILAVTVIVKAAFFPLANKSYVSMAKMKKLQPQMEALRERHKDDKTAMQRELMGLYQKEKINPMAGCLPVLLQVPVFFSLYKVLFVTIDMRQAPFFGWIKDLSAADPTTVFNLFGLLPFTPPEMLHLGVWPLIMGVTMWVQMQLNPKQPDPTQQMIFNWMPVMFTFMLGSFPAGLVIYWAWNNLLSIGQQSLIMKRQGADIPLLENIGLGHLFGKGKADPKPAGKPTEKPTEKTEAKAADKPVAAAAKPADKPAGKVDAKTATKPSANGSKPTDKPKA